MTTKKELPPIKPEESTELIGDASTPDDKPAEKPKKKSNRTPAKKIGAKQITVSQANHHINSKFEKTLKEHVAMIRDAHAETVKLLDAAVSEKQRSLTNEYLEQETWKIWQYCRENKDSLDSSKHCKIIREVIDSAVIHIQRRLEYLATELNQLRLELRLAKQETRLGSKLDKAITKFDKMIAKQDAWLDYQGCPTPTVELKKTPEDGEEEEAVATI